MSLEEFLHNLHFNIDKASPPDWEVNWKDSPLPYKLYRELPVFPLSLEIPLTLEGIEAAVKPDHYTIGCFLWLIYGLTQYSQSIFPSDSIDQAVEVMQSYRRFVPSGGALYPNELYVYLKIEELPVGVYHYDVAHHSLVLLREGNFDLYLDRALGIQNNISLSFGTVFVSTMFWKNFFKYHNFSYRLQGLDAGVMIGQLLEVAKRFGFASKVHFQYLDRAINHLLGLSEQEESVYAVIPLSLEQDIPIIDKKNLNECVSAAALCQELTPIKTHHYVRSRKMKEFPMLKRMNEASMLESTGEFRQIKMRKRINDEGQVIALPHVKRLSYDLASSCRKRYSLEMDFVLGKVSRSMLAALLQETLSSFSYQNDLEGTDKKQKSRVFLYGCLYNIEGIPDGAYQYDSDAHGLRPIDLGDYRLTLQYGLSLDNVNLIQVPLCLHVAGDKDHYKGEWGSRGYRIQQMEAGMLVQRLLLAASAIGMGGHPLLGFDVNLCDKIYKMESQGKTSLIQIPIGFYRPRPWLKGSLQS